MSFAKGDNKDDAPLSTLLFSVIFRVKLDKLRRFAKGDNKDYAPMYPI